jgi:hypothetical protein
MLEPQVVVNPLLKLGIGGFGQTWLCEGFKDAGGGFLQRLGGLVEQTRRREHAPTTK